jgi:hypothetical protein
MIGKALRLLKCLVRNDCPLKIRGKDLFSIMVTASEREQSPASKLGVHAYGSGVRAM